MLVLPPGTDLHNHHLVTDGKVFLQGKASCMVAVALCPKPGWTVIDACAAPGNKTVHLAALMNGEGSIIACDFVSLTKRGPKLWNILSLNLEQTILKQLTAFLDINTNDPSYAEVHAILLDPSCSGSGISTERLDHFLHTQEVIRMMQLLVQGAAKTEIPLHLVPSPPWRGWSTEPRQNLKEAGVELILPSHAKQTATAGILKHKLQTNIPDIKDDMNWSRHFIEQLARDCTGRRSQEVASHFYHLNLYF
ncbi:hypothetical protein GUJ93_ZPchr0121g51 [Zizania palustris]|uniref:SAM-dependent MTase RsmB/NOP-type domain-containing protein n=1 Tax=Zizania palustris TaxID=103762 RepID=A0A8J5R282_ZIZPA|nr:hypothetical protein GUJ93_ZPchr0121g51 [Zizania palustris]